MHPQYFWWGTTVNNFLFKGFSVSSASGLVAICFLIAFMSFIFEYLRFVQTKHKQRELILRAKQIKLMCPTESASLLATTVTNPQNPLNITIFDRALLFGSEVSLWLVLQNLGYFIMLAVMIYDGWFLVSAVIGGGIGYFIFGQLFMKINLQNCQIMRSAYCTQICGDADGGGCSSKEGESTPVLEETPSTSHNELECHKKRFKTTTVQCHA